MSGLALVTGAAGFIGGRVAARLAASGWRVVGIGHGAPHAGTGMAMRWVASDVSAAALAGLGCAPDAIVHCAGTASVGRAASDPVGERLRTVGATRAVLEFSASLSVPARLVLVSSGAVYGGAALMPTPESAPVAPVSRYGELKAESESMWRDHSRRFGHPAVIARLFSVYGEGLRKQLLWDACRKFMRVDGRFDGTGDETRDWLNVDDAADLLALAIGWARKDCPVVNGGTGSSASVREILQVLRAALDCTSPLEFSGVVRAGDPMHYAANVALAASWGWCSRIAWRDGVARYARWFATQGVAI